MMPSKILLAATACLFATSASPVLAQDSVAVRIPGGEVDPTLVEIGDVYLTPPIAAKPTRGCKIAQDYVQRINATRYDEIADLFSEDGVFMEPVRGGRAVGRAEIDAIYRKRIGTGMRPSIIPVSYVGQGRECMVVLAAMFTIEGKERWMMASIDHFTTNAAGRATRMVAFSRPISSGARLTARQ